MTVRPLRLVVETENYDQAVRFYRDVLGLPAEFTLDSDRGARVTILTAGRATLEIINPAQRKMIDELEVGRQVSPRIRLAFEVDDAATTTQRLAAAGASQVAPPTRTPWNSLNARLGAPASLHRAPSSCPATPRSSSPVSRTARQPSNASPSRCGGPGGTS